MGKSKAPEYAKTTYNTGGLFGSSTSDKGGTSYTPESWMTNTMNTVGTGVNTSLQNMLSNDYANDANFQAYQNQLYNTMGQQYDQMLGNLADRGLMRSTGLQALNDNYAKALQDNVTSLYDNYYNRQANNLQNAMNTSNSLYNYVNGITGNNMQQSNAVSNHYMEAYKADQALKGQMYQALGQAVAGFAGGGGEKAKEAGTLASLGASDINVKENIEFIEEKDGYRWYSFDYKDGYGLPKGRQKGVIAQEVQKVNPEAVKDINGILHVDYSKL